MIDDIGDIDRPDLLVGVEVGDVTVYAPVLDGYTPTMVEGTRRPSWPTSATSSVSPRPTPGPPGPPWKTEADDDLNDSRGGPGRRGDASRSTNDAKVSSFYNDLETAGQYRDDRRAQSTVRHTGAKVTAGAWGSGALLVGVMLVMMSKRIVESCFDPSVLPSHRRRH